MTTAGWLFMLTSWAVILGLFIFCMIRTLQPPKQGKKQNPGE